MNDFFISYTQSDRVWAEWIAWQLEQSGYSVILQAWDFGPGSNFVVEMDSAAKSSERTLAILSTDYIKSIYATSEWAAAFALDPTGKERRLLPIKVNELKLDGMLAQIVYINLVGLNEVAARDRLLAGVGEKRAKPSEAPHFPGKNPHFPGETISTSEYEANYPDQQTRDLSQGLEEAYGRYGDLLTKGQDTSLVEEEILNLRRQIREGGQLRPGDFLLHGRFKLLESIGQGGFARVWKAYDQEEHTLIAIKVLHGQYAEDRTRRERFFRGAKWMSRLQHRGIVRVIEQVCEDGGYYFFAMEYVEGRDLHQEVISGRLSREELLEIILGAGDALHFSHENNLIHRDVKPANILLDKGMKPKLTDFDLVRAPGTTGGTRPGMLGTVVYAAPEAMEMAKDAGILADVYGLGMTTIFVLYGSDLPVGVIRDTQTFIKGLDIPKQCGLELAKAVSWTLSERHPTVRDFCQSLSATLGSEKAPPAPQPIQSPIKRNDDLPSVVPEVRREATTEVISKRYFLEIRKTLDHYKANIHQGIQGKGHSLPFLAIDPDIEPVAGTSHTLGSLIQNFQRVEHDADMKTFSERFLLELGQYLYEQTFGQLKAGLPPEESDTQVQIVTDDEYVARLPWAILARSGVFLYSSGWTLALSRPRRGHIDCSLPPSPKMLVIMPQPTGMRDTHAEAHLEDLEFMLTSMDHHFGQGRHLQVATTWEEFRHLAEEFQPDLLYYYGHIAGDLHTTRLVFSSKGSKRPDLLPVTDLAQQLHRASGKPPVLMYFNGCLGDASGLLGAGWQLSEIAPAVVTSFPAAVTDRTEGFIEAAQLQANHFWRAVILDGKPPHYAISEMYVNLGDMGLNSGSARLLTPVLHRHYDNWESHPPRPSNRIADPYWHVKVDRVQQFGQVVFQTQRMLLNRTPACLAYLWYGQAGQGVELFHQRIKVELREFLSENFFYEVRPRWPDDVSEPHRAFEDMMLEVFGVSSLGDIRGRIRSLSRGEDGRDTFVYIRHEPIRPTGMIKPSSLRAYYEWLDDVFVPLLREASAFSLLGISFVAQKPVALLRILEKVLDGLKLEYLNINILDELDRLAKKDLIDFLRTHGITLPKNQRDRVLEEILTTTQGNYEMTLEALRDLVYRAWDGMIEGHDMAVVGDDDEW